jgi:hypothetical protein
MGFKLVNSEWLNRQTNKAASVFKAELVKGAEYTQQELIDILADEDEVYSVPEFQEIRVELVQRGILEGEEDPEPE